MNIKYFKLIFIVTTIWLVVVTVRTVYFSPSNSKNTIAHRPIDEHAHNHKVVEEEKDAIDEIVEVALRENEDSNFETLPLAYKVDLLIQKGDLESFKEILRNQDSIKSKINDSSNEDGRTLLTRAALGAQLPFVKFLVEELGADVNVADRDQITPLMEASASENIEVVQYLIQKNANINAQNKLGADPLTIALSSGDPQLAVILLNKGANANLKWNRKNFSHLMNAARNGHRELVQVLLRHQARINDKDDLGNTALHYAAAQGFKDIVSDLLQAGAIKEIKNKEGHRPIDLAKREGFSFIEQALK